MNIGFLFNHDQIHQVAHSLPIAIELHRRGRVGNVVVLTGGAHLTAEVRRHLDAAGCDLPCIELSLHNGLAKTVAKVLDRVVPARKLALYRDNLDVFRRLDVLVVAEKTSTILKTRYGLNKLKLVHTRHGAGDRAIGFDAASRRFDHVLVAGTAIRERLIREAQVPEVRVTTVGYPKFDLVAKKAPRLPMQDNGRPTILYNPHLAPHLSSWYRDGRAVLDYFVSSERYNLIFAPHVMLFHRPIAVTISPFGFHFPGAIPRAAIDAPNIYIDLSSPACSDMTYTSAADIYLGDVSSQTYEFLLKPRPCIFMNSHHLDYVDDPNFTHWRAGQVIDDVGDLDAALDDAVRHPDHFTDIQRDLFASHIDLTTERSSARAAVAIETLASRDETVPLLQGVLAGQSLHNAEQHTGLATARVQ